MNAPMPQNREQLAVCIRWVDDQLQPHEDLLVYTSLMKPILIVSQEQSKMS